MKDAPTPETDAEANRLGACGLNKDFAQRLERQRDAAKADHRRCLDQWTLSEQRNKELIEEVQNLRHELIAAQRALASSEGEKKTLLEEIDRLKRRAP